MADYAFSMTVTGYVPGTTTIDAVLKLSDGQTANQTKTVTTPGDPVSFFVGPLSLTGSEDLWITFECADNAPVPETIDIKTIGPYLVSDVGLLP